MKGLENFKGLANGDFIKAAALTAATTFASPSVQAGDNPAYPPELEPGNCAPTSEIQQALQTDEQRIFLGAEMYRILYEENGSPRRNDKGQVLFEERELLFTADEQGDWYALIGNANLEGTSTEFCVNIAGENLKVVNNQSTPQTIPYPDDIPEQAIQKQLHNDTNQVGYIFAQGHDIDLDTTYTIFVTNELEGHGKNFIVYSHHNDREDNWLYGGDDVSIQEFGRGLAQRHRQDLKAGL